MTYNIEVYLRHGQVLAMSKIEDPAALINVNTPWVTVGDKEGYVIIKHEDIVAVRAKRAE